MTIEEEVTTELRTLALTDWGKFLEVTGVDIQRLTICKQRKKGKTLQQIAKAMQMNKQTVWHKCKDC